MNSKNKKVIVTGGCGFIGSNLVDLLIKNDYQVGVIDDLSSGKKENLNQKAELFKVDLKRPKKVEEVIGSFKPQAIFHLAAQVNVRKSLKNPLKDAKNNIISSINLFKTAGESDVKKIIYSSTGGAVYGDPKEIPCQETSKIAPLSPYGTSKHASEHYLQMYSGLLGFDYIILRYSNVYGPRQDPLGEAGVVSIFTNQLLNKKQPYINGDGKQTRDFVFVGDVARANLKALQAKPKDNVFNIGTGKQTSINELYRQIKEAVGAKTKAQHKKAIPGEVRHTYLDISRAKKGLNWQPKYNLKKGIKETIDWMKDIN